MYKFDAKTNAFYPYSMQADYEVAGTWPEKGVDVDESIFAEFTGTAPEKKMRGSDKKGNPAWVDIPLPTKEELIANAETKKQMLMAEATIAITPLHDAVDLGMATPEEESALEEWKKYRVLLNRVDTSSAPDINWPVKPA
ncbi:tail fiber assembly protein [Morganella morganii]